jgi:hypothetical protein
VAPSGDVTCRHAPGASRIVPLLSLFMLHAWRMARLQLVHIGTDPACFMLRVLESRVLVLVLVHLCTYHGGVSGVEESLLEASEFIDDARGKIFRIVCALPNYV